MLVVDSSQFSAVTSIALGVFTNSFRTVARHSFETAVLRCSQRRRRSHGKRASGAPLVTASGCSQRRTFTIARMGTASVKYVLVWTNFPILEEEGAVVVVVVDIQGMVLKAGQVGMLRRDHHIAQLLAAR